MPFTLEVPENEIKTGRFKIDVPEADIKPAYEPSVTPYEDRGALGAFFPASTKAEKEGKGKLISDVAYLGDILTLPARGTAAIATGLGTLHGGGSLKEAGREAMKEFGKTESEETGIKGVAQNIALDPTSSPLLLGLGAPAKAAKAVPTFGKALAKTALAGAGTGAGSAAYQSVASEGGIDPGRVVTQAALGAGTGALMSSLGTAAKKGLGKLLKGSAERNIDITLRPGQTGRKMGYSHEPVIKYDLGGTPRETFEKASALLSDLQDQAKLIAKESDATFNLDEIFTNAAKKLKRIAAPEDYDKQMALLSNAYESYYNAFGPEMDAVSAMGARSRIGDKTAFVGRSQGGMKIDPDADWKEKVYNELYHEFKKQLHDNLGGELKAINKAQSEIIPVKRVAERRIPIAESNQRIGLSDLLTTRVGQGLGGAAIGGSVGYGSGGDLESTLKGAAVGAGLAGTRKFLGGPTATKAMYKLGERLLR